ncbi:MAG: hypothetical protein IPI01_20720 [Ignavibacteriae bacterium]|nr:hypothetical protein [Ignavibacteriota bacterium]
MAGFDPGARAHDDRVRKDTLQAVSTINGSFRDRQQHRTPGSSGGAPPSMASIVSDNFNGASLNTGSDSDRSTR